MQTSHEYLLFKLGQQTLSMPMQQVNHVAQMASEFTYRGDTMAAHFVFSGQPLSYVSLWDKLGQNSLYIEYENMLAMLPQRLNDHLEWMGALSTSIRTGVPFAKARSPYECAFGKWYYAHRSDDRRLSLLLDQFEVPHARIHGLADRLLALSESGDVDEAMRQFDDAEHTTLAQLKGLFQSTADLVKDLQRRVAIIVSDETGAPVCALGADAISDIVNVPAEQVRPMGRLDHQHPSASLMAGMLVLDDSRVVPIMDWSRLN